MRQDQFLYIENKIRGVVEDAQKEIYRLRSVAADARRERQVQILAEEIKRNISQDDT